jgi:hypothetical protein
MRQIIVTDIETYPGGSFKVTALLWLDVPGKRWFRPQQTSLPSQSPLLSWGATSEELAFFAKGIVTERTVISNPFPMGTSVEAVQALLLTAYQAAQAQLEASANINLDVVGQHFDGSVWGTAKV